jgi:hypothetical protein
LPRAVDEMGETAFVVFVEPSQGFAGIFGSGAVVHGDEFFYDAHGCELIVMEIGGLPEGV